MKSRSGRNRQLVREDLKEDGSVLGAGNWGPGSSDIGCVSPRPEALHTKRKNG